MTDAQITAVFEGAGDFIRRELQCGEYMLYAYAIDGLVSSADASEYVFRPIAINLRGDSMRELYQNALHGGVYNTVAGSCKGMDDIALKLVNGFCVVLFPNVGAIAFYRKQGFELIGYDACCYTNIDVERHEIRFDFGYFLHRRGGR